MKKKFMYDENVYLDFLDPIDRKIILYNEYEHDSVSFLEDLFAQHSISNFLDIGANSGYFSFYFANKFKNLKVKAYEPNLEAFEKFKKTLNKNLFKNIYVIFCQLIRSHFQRIRSFFYISFFHTIFNVCKFHSTITNRRSSIII